MPIPSKSKAKSNQTFSPPSKSLCLPDGYQRYSYYEQGKNPNGVRLDCSKKGVEDLLELNAIEGGDRFLYLYTHHEVFLQDGIIKHTRSSPNFEGGLVTYATCKHLMRSYNRDKDGGWVNTWLVGLCPKKGLNNCVMFVGQVSMEFERNIQMGTHLMLNYPEVIAHKLAMTNPRGDVYTLKEDPPTNDLDDHNNYLEPPNHTRSLEFYKKSPGSVSDRPDGKIPKYWRDIEYQNAQGRRPPSFILSPCFLFSKPTLYTSYQPKRATLKLDPMSFVKSLSTTPNS